MEIEQSPNCPLQKKIEVSFLLLPKHSRESNGYLILLLPDFPLEKNFKFVFLAQALRKIEWPFDSPLQKQISKFFFGSSLGTKESLMASPLFEEDNRVATQF